MINEYKINLKFDESILKFYGIIWPQQLIQAEKTFQIMFELIVYLSKPNLINTPLLTDFWHDIQFSVHFSSTLL